MEGSRSRIPRHEVGDAHQGKYEESSRNQPSFLLLSYRVHGPPRVSNTQRVRQMYSWEPLRDYARSECGSDGLRPSCSTIVIMSFESPLFAEFPELANLS